MVVLMVYSIRLLNGISWSGSWFAWLRNLGWLSQFGDWVPRRHCPNSGWINVRLGLVFVQFQKEVLDYPIIGRVNLLVELRVVLSVLLVTKYTPFRV